MNDDANENNDENNYKINKKTTTNVLSIRQKLQEK